MMEILKVDLTLLEELSIWVNATLTTLDIVIQIDRRDIGDDNEHSIVEVDINQEL